MDRHDGWIAASAEVRQAIAALCSAFAGGGKLLVCGCGGSAADASHIAGELVKGFEAPSPLPQGLAERIEEAAAAAAANCGDVACGVARDLAGRLQRGLPCMSLAADSAVLTAIVNDIGGDVIFAQQVAALGRPGDALLAISTSGNSRPVLNAAAVARAVGMAVVGFTGEGGGALAGMCDVAVKVPAAATAEVQQLHVAVYHHMCREIERWWAQRAGAGSPDR